MDFLLTRFRNLAVLLLVILGQLILLAYQVKTQQDVSLVRVWSVTAITPIAKVLEIVRANTIGLVENYFVLVNVREDNRRLNDEMGRLKMENQFLKTELETAERARALQAFQAQTPSRTIPARVIGTGTGTNSRVVFLDQGSGAGVIKGMAVVTPDGIVGKVLASYPTASQVLLITDPTFAAGVVSNKNRVHGTVKGLGQSKVRVDYVQNEEKVEVGEVFFTSGDDRVFPKGMPVGKVGVVKEGKTFKEIFLVPSGLQNGVEEVLIVVEGVHQSIPEPETAVATGNNILPPPPPDSAESSMSATAAGVSPTLMTEADRLRERYKKIGEAQGHTYGEGTAARIPNFNLDPNAQKPAQAPGQTPAPTPGQSAAAPKPAPTGSTAIAPRVQPTQPSQGSPGTAPTRPIAPATSQSSAPPRLIPNPDAGTVPAGSAPSAVKPKPAPPSQASPGITGTRPTAPASSSPAAAAPAPAKSAPPRLIPNPDARTAPGGSAPSAVKPKPVPPAREASPEQ